MTTSAERREQLENHLKAFREIADQRVNEKIIQWSIHLPAMLSAAIFVCQVANTIIFASFAYNFGKLSELLDEYMRETEAMNVSLPNSTVEFRVAGVNAERIAQIDNYHDQLWNLFIAEVIELIFPAINLCMFAWIMHMRIKDKRCGFPTRIQMIYLLCPALALILSVTQALTIHVTITESIYTIRFLLAKLLGILLEANRQGRFPIEQFFECEFFNDDDIVKPPCAGQIHDTVLSKSTLTVVISIHVIPIIICVYLLLRNLKSNKLEHLFLYIESVTPPPPPVSHPTPLPHMKRSTATDSIESGEESLEGEKEEEEKEKDEQKGRYHCHSLKETLNELLAGFTVKFTPKKIFCEQTTKTKNIECAPSAMERHCSQSVKQQNSRELPREERRKNETSL